MKFEAPLINPYLDLYSVLGRQAPELQLSVRKKLIWAYSWAVPSQKAIEELAQLSPLVEIGAGTGYWAWLLRQTGADVLAFDQNPGGPPTWTAIERGGPENAHASRERTLFLCWPSFDTNFSQACLSSFEGSKVAYVGEWRGRTADSSFHDKLERDWTLQKTVPIPTWPSYRDQLFILRRNMDG